MSCKFIEKEDFQRVKQVFKYKDSENVFGSKDTENDVQHTVAGNPDIFNYFRMRMLKMQDWSQFSTMTTNERQTVFLTSLYFSKTKNWLNF